MATEHITTGEARDDLRAAVGARRDLGEEYEPEVIDAFMDRLDARIAGRVDQELAARAGTVPHEYQNQYQNQNRYQPTPVPQLPHKGDSAATWVALASLVLGVPITAVATDNAGILGAMVAWAGIATVNVAHAIGRWGRPG
jgi:hypothetical protein